MPLLLVCGRPCSGKSTVTKLVAKALESAGCDVIIVDEPTCHIDKNKMHKDAHAEKVARSLLRAATDRALQRPNTYVLLDYMSGIKGYRYELWCMARERATRCALLHCVVPRDAVETWRAGHATLSTDAATTPTSPPSPKPPPPSPSPSSTPLPLAPYQPHHAAIFDDLWSRFEVPDTRNRWDRPLFEVDPRNAQLLQRTIQAAVATLRGTRVVVVEDVEVGVGDELGAGGAVQGAAPPAALHGEGDVQTLDMHALSITHDDGGGSSTVIPSDTHSSGGAFVPATRVLRPTIATTRQLATDTNRRTMIDSATQAVVRAVCDAQAVNGGVGPVDLTLEPQGPTYRLPQSIPVAVLRNHKRAFMRIATQVLGGRVENEAAVKKMFVEYLAERCR